MSTPFVATFIRYALRTVFGLVLTALALIVIYLLFAYHFSYSKGDSVGYVQKLSHKGWICKTWEGEQIRALSSVPMTPEKFIFTVRDETIVNQINTLISKKVVLEYEQHKGLPSCFGDTEYFVTNVHPAPEQ